ncbi:phosphatidate cytidylyltransferase [Syntrophomonas erecta]
MFKTRTITALLGVPILIGVIYLGEVPSKVLFFLMAVMALYEFFRMMIHGQQRPMILTGFLFLAVLLLVNYQSIYYLPSLLTVLAIAVVILVVSYPRFSIIGLSLSIFFSLYLGVMLSFAFRAAETDCGFELLLLALLLTWASDVGGYTAGRLWGKSKLTPLLSPQKTWAGALGAVALSIVVAVVFLGVIEWNGAGMAYAILLGIVSSLAAQFGDLFISAVKRYFGVKDAGNIIPGHGGVLDRFDSFLLVIPVVYYLASLLPGY